MQTLPAKTEWVYKGLRACALWVHRQVFVCTRIPSSDSHQAGMLCVPSMQWRQGGLLRAKSSDAMSWERRLGRRKTGLCKNVQLLLAALCCSGLRVCHYSSIHIQPGKRVLCRHLSTSLGGLNLEVRGKPLLGV